MTINNNNNNINNETSIYEAPFLRLKDALQQQPGKMYEGIKQRPNKANYSTKLHIGAVIVPTVELVLTLST